ncbi:MAG: molybdenum ABC transporter ATP-binding protein [Hyphomicrobium sp.]|nr:molybdenum ABC transporter ATP-binding protein [Hyphomicrobium sp.]
MIEFAAHLTQGRFVLDAEFETAAGVTALFGPSGSGKTTIINLIGGLTRPQKGRIVVGDRVLVDTDRRIFVPMHKRRIGLVFQDAQLFPHLTVDQNLRFGRWFAPRDPTGVAIELVVERLGIRSLLSRRPSRLSGGEKQRVALARALLASPHLLLMDEPLAGLDQNRKTEIFPLIEMMRDDFKIPIVYVTHALDEVARLASFVVRLDAGRVIATGSAAGVVL